MQGIVHERGLEIRPDEEGVGEEEGAEEGEDSHGVKVIDNVAFQGAAVFC